MITSVICLYELYQMRTISDHLSRAFSYQIIGTIGALASLIIGLLSLAQVAFLAIIVSAGFSAARLYLLYTYLQAVRVREEQPLL